MEKINMLEQKYYDVVGDLFGTDKYQVLGRDFIRNQFDFLRSFSRSVFTIFEEKEILAQGELISTGIFQLYMEEQKQHSILLPALDFMKIDKNSEPDSAYISENLSKLLDANPDVTYYITQGYICRNFYGEVDNLQRGGSDYTASLVGAAIKAEEIQIWTDIDGMHNNDPRFTEGTKPVPYLNFEEAAELAYFGAKILHPTCILPAKLNNIPVRLLNTMEPSASGTLISMKSIKDSIQAVAAKDGITAVKIKSGRMLLAYGFLRKVFEIFESYQTPIDMVTTSEVGVSVTIDNTKNLDEILDSLKKLGTVTVDRDMVIICVVGDLQPDNLGFQSKAVNAMRNIPVRMISYGGSNFNISFLVKSADKKAALQALSAELF
jgi:aspartate kinase